MLPHSIREINTLPEEEKLSIYGTLIPVWVFQEYNLDPSRIFDPNYPNINIRCREGTRAVEIIIKQDPADIDAIMYLNMVDTFSAQLMVLLVVVNDPDATRYNTDLDENGNKTNFGTTSRNLYAEAAAMRAGLAPGQVKRGLRAFKHSLPIFENFVEKMGHTMYLIEPLAYHNAISFERHGFNYIKGFKDMQEIHEGFMPGGEFYLKLNPSNPFRNLDAWKTVRGRSWAIHDGILGHPFTGFQMYKRINQNAGINTFPGSVW